MKLICLICELPIKHADELEHGCAMGVTYHKICSDIAVANLAAELGSYMDAHPQLYEKVSEGRYRSVEPTSAADSS